VVLFVCAVARDVFVESSDGWKLNGHCLQRKPSFDMRSAAENFFLALYDARKDLIGGCRPYSPVRWSYMVLTLQRLVLAGPNFAAMLLDHGTQLAAGSSPTITPEARRVALFCRPSHASSPFRLFCLSPSPRAQLLFWDRVYLCMGLTSYSLRDYLDMPTWFASCFQPLMAALLGDQQRPCRPPVILRRLVYLVSCMVTDIPSELKPALYPMLVSARGGRSLCVYACLRSWRDVTCGP
jgi:hypothetical protein